MVLVNGRVVDLDPDMEHVGLDHLRTFDFCHQRADPQ